MNFLRSLAVLVFLLSLAACDQLAQRQADATNRRLAEDAEQQYQITKRAGIPSDQCAQAGVVAAAYLQAKDENRYAHWKAVEAGDCARAITLRLESTSD